MGFNGEEKQATPPPWGWPPAAKEKAHGVGEIVYDRSCRTTDHTEDRRHEQEKVYHKTRGGLHLTDRQREILGTAWNQEKIICLSERPECP